MSVINLLIYTKLYNKFNHKIFKIILASLNKDSINFWNDNLKIKRPYKLRDLTGFLNLLGLEFSFNNSFLEIITFST